MAESGAEGTRRLRIAFDTLGCKLNQFETDALATQFRTNGYEVVPYGSEADAYVVNTCTVTNKSDRKSRNVINRVARPRDAARNEAADREAAGGRPIVVVTGCFVDSNRSYLETRHDITYVVDNRRKSRIFDIVDAHFRGEIMSADSLARLEGSPFGYSLADRSFHTRSMVKIQDGCDNFCTFCIIPFVRGRAVSRPLPEILDNVRRLVVSGSREIVLTGVNMGRYKRDEVDFTGVVRKILELPLEFRLRISSIEPEGLGEPFIDLLAHPKMCPHLHLCLQSGADRILLQMRRMYSLAYYRWLVGNIRERYPLFNLTTDIIVGFPGESEADFGETCRVCREVGFSHIHTFKYSVRSGTRAERMSGQISEEVKSERSEIVREISEENKRRYRTGLIGRVERVLVERAERAPAGRARVAGLSEHYVPVSAEIEVDEPAIENRFIDVEITGIENGNDPSLLGRVVREAEAIEDLA